MIIAVALLNLILGLLALTLSSDWLAFNAWMLFLLQSVTLIPILFGRIKFVKNFFLPSVFVLVYFLVNFTLGSYLVPRGYGWNKEFSAIAYGGHLNVIVPFFLLCDLVIFLLAIRDLGLVEIDDGFAQKRIAKEYLPNNGSEIVQTLFFFSIFLMITALEIYSLFSFQLAIIIIHVTTQALKRNLSRFGSYIFYLGVITAFQPDNKREIIMALFLMIMVEAYFTRMRVSFRPRIVVGALVAALAFFFLIATASILRGYGGFPVSNFFDAMYYVPSYIFSDNFVDGITDNLELNYNYGVAVTSLQLLMDGRIDYQFGGSLIKVFFLPIPREILAWKPESVLQIFTKEYAPAWWYVGGSMPVMFASEMFINFGFLAVLAVALILRALDWLFCFWNRHDKLSFGAMSAAFIVATTLMLARGGGIEQSVVYYAFGALPLAAWSVLITARRAQSAMAQEQSR